MRSEESGITVVERGEPRETLTSTGPVREGAVRGLCVEMKTAQ